METIRVDKKTLSQAVKAHYRARVRRWEAAGAKGKKPRLWQSAEIIFERGLDHPETKKELHNDT